MRSFPIVRRSTEGWSSLFVPSNFAVLVGVGPFRDISLNRTHIVCITRLRLDAAGHEFDPRVRPMAPLGLPDYLALQINSRCTISDSGTITEESSMLGFPAVTVREAHERPEGMDNGVVVMSGVGRERLLDAIELTIRQFETSGPPMLPDDYSALDVSWKVCKIILSYTDYVNRVVWRA